MLSDRESNPSSEACSVEILNATEPSIPSYENPHFVHRGDYYHHDADKLEVIFLRRDDIPRDTALLISSLWRQMSPFANLGAKVGDTRTPGFAWEKQLRVSRVARS